MARLGKSPEGPGQRRSIGRLIVATGTDAGRVVLVVDGTVLGRDTTADVVLEDPDGSMSRRHARIRLDGGAPVVEDLGSTNGTCVNGERIERARTLAAGDRIQVGGTTLEFAPAPEAPGAGRVAPDAHLADKPATQGEPPSSFAPPGTDGQLWIVRGPGAGATAPVVGSATIGREPECDVQLLDGEVSRRHAKVTVRDGSASIDDLHSANGTYVNGDRILKRRTLGPEDRIQIGEATIVLTSPMFEGTVVRPHPAQVTGTKEILAGSRQLLAGDSGTRKWWTLAIVLVAAFMLLLDVTIVGVALPSIAADLNPSFTSLQWIVDAYAMMLTVVLLTAGSLADIFGRKRVLSIGLVVFVASSVLCAQAPNATVLAFGRGVQGIGGAVMYACLLALIVQEFPADERAVAFGLYGAVNAVAIALGPIVGGVLVEVFGWEAIFYLNVPIGIATLVVMDRKLVNLPGPQNTVDWAGLVTSSGAIFLAVFATIQGNDTGWTSPTILGCYATAIVLIGLFVVIELRSRSPMFDVRLLRNPTFLGSSVSAFTLCFSVLALIFFFTIWFQSILGYSAIGTGARMLAFAAIGGALGPLAGKLTTSVDPRFVLTASLALAAVGTFTMIGVDADSSWTAILPGLVLTGAGLGLIGPTLASTATSVVPPWRGGMAGGINSTMRQLGTAAGIAVLGTVLHHRVLVNVERALEGSFLSGASTNIANAIAAGATPALLADQPPSARAGLLAVARDSYAEALSTVFVIASVVATVGAVTAFALVRRRHMLVGPPARPPLTNPESRTAGARSRAAAPPAG